MSIDALIPVDTIGRRMRDLRISITDRCNFRCTYCMPAEIFGDRYEFLPRDELLTFEEIARLAEIFVSMGVAKVRITGGEPLVRNGIESLVGMLSSIQGLDDLTMTTNAYLLPQKAITLRSAGLERITVSLDTLDDLIFKEMNGVGFGTARVLEGIEAASDAGFRPIKINSVVQRGVNDHKLVDLVRYAKERGHIVRFIEYMDVGNLNDWKLDEVVSADEILARIDSEFPLQQVKANYSGEVATRYQFKDGSGEIGVIASVTKPFCGNCTRLRLSPEGRMFTCLFGVKGIDLREPMRRGASDLELKALISGTWQLRTDRYSEERSSLTNKLRQSIKKVEMYHIGG